VCVCVCVCVCVFREASRVEKLQIKMENAFIESAALAECAVVCSMLPTLTLCITDTFILNHLQYARAREDVSNEHLQRSLNQRRLMREKRLEAWNQARDRLDQLVAIEEQAVREEELLLYDMGNVTRWLTTCDSGINRELIQPLSVQYSRVVLTRGSLSSAPFNFEGDKALEHTAARRLEGRASFDDWSASASSADTPLRDAEAESQLGSDSAQAHAPQARRAARAPGSSPPSTFVDAASQVLHSLVQVTNAYRSLFDYRENLMSANTKAASKGAAETTEMLLELVHRFEHEAQQTGESLSSTRRMHERILECQRHVASLHEQVTSQELIGTGGLQSAAAQVLQQLRDNAASLSADIHAGSSGDIEVDGNGEIRAASSNKLVEILTSSDAHNSVLFQKLFLMTYRYYMSVPQLVEKLVMRYCIAPDPCRTDVIDFCTTEQRPARMRVLAVLQFWVANYFDLDFVDDNHRRLLEGFIHNTVNRTGNHSHGKELLLLLEARTAKHQELLATRASALAPATQATASSTASAQQQSPKPSSIRVSWSKTLPSQRSTPNIRMLGGASPPDTSNGAHVSRSGSGSSNTDDSSVVVEVSKATSTMPATTATVPDDALCAAAFSLLDHSPFEIASQLTLIDVEYYRHIRWHELVQQKWSKRDKNTLAPGIVAFTQHFNTVARWVVLQVVQEHDVARRAAVIRRMIVIAMHMYRINNYNGVFEILAGLDNTAVARLRKTWNLVGFAMYQVKEQLRQLLVDNYVLYRRDVRVANAPCVPYIGTFLKDLTFLEDGNPTHTASGLVNFFKFRRIAEAIHSLLQFQQAEQYKLLPNETLAPALRNLSTIDDNDAYMRSQHLESSADLQDEGRFRYSPPSSPDDMLQIIRALRTHSILIKEERLAIAAAAATAAAAAAAAAAASSSASSSASSPSLSGSGSSAMGSLSDHHTDDMASYGTDDENAEYLDNTNAQQEDFLEEVVLAMRNSVGGLDIRTRRHLLKSYKHCFIGSEAVTWMVENLALASRDEAVQLGQELLFNNYIQHVSDDHDFRDKNMFYRFRDRTAMIQLA
jgi:hypothetical protein